jgi:hypothetical protein
VISAGVLHCIQEDAVKRKAKKQKPNERPALEWRASRTVKWQDELCTHDGPVATLRWAGLLSYMATGTAQEGQWTFDRPRFLSRDVEVRTVSSDAKTPYAVYYPGWAMGGRVEFAGGRTLHWAPMNFWQTQWTFMDEAERTLVQFEDTSCLFEERAAVTFVRPGLSETDRGLLLLLGRYLMALQSRDNAAIVAATTTACYS